MVRAVRPLGLASLDLASETRASLAVCRSIAVPLAAAPRRLDRNDVVVVDHSVSSRKPSVELPPREQGCCSSPIGINKVEGRRRHGLVRKIRRWTDSYLGPRRRICRAVLGGERFENHLLKHHLVAVPDRQLVRMQLGPLCLATIDGVLDVGTELVQKVVARTGNLPRPRLFELLLALELRGVIWASVGDLFDRRGMQSWKHTFRIKSPCASRTSGSSGSISAGTSKRGNLISCIFCTCSGADVVSGLLLLYVLLVSDAKQDLP